MGAAWERHGSGMGAAWERHGSGMGTAWERHGNGMVCVNPPLIAVHYREMEVSYLSL
jgi:hypothetical protein